MVANRPVGRVAQAADSDAAARFPAVVGNGSWLAAYLDQRFEARGDLLIRDQGSCWARKRDRRCDLRLPVNGMELAGGDLVLVSETAEDLSSADPVIGEVDQLRWPGVSLSRRELAKGTVRPGCRSAAGTRSAPGAGGAH
jgi:hypothetical protein